MAESEPLDLNRVDPPIWHVLVSETAYGPYTLGQLRGFIVEGRISARSKIAEGDGGRFLAAAECPKLAATFAEIEKQTDTPKLGNYVVIAHLAADDRALVNTLNQLGSFGEAMPGVFLLRSNVKLSQVQARLSSIATGGEKIMIVDASNDRLAWFGLGPEADTHMKAVWSKDAA